MASRDEVERSLQELIERLRGTDEELTIVSAYLTGRVRVDAGVADMLQLRRML